MDYLSVLKDLSQCTAISGYEKNLALKLKDLFGKMCDTVEVDRFFNVIGTKKGCSDHGKKVMITAHMDEIGLIVTGIDEKGFISFSSVGGVDSKILLAQEVIIHGKKEFIGIIGAKPPHLLKPDESKKAPQMKDLVIDTGLCADEVKSNISVGDLISFRAVPFELKGSKLASKSLDNRASVVALLEIVNELSVIKHKSEVYLVATSQEEVGLAGAKTVAYNITPDVAIVIDVCHGDIPDASKDETYSLGKGPAIGVGPVLNKNLTKKMIELAKEQNISYQIDIEHGSTGTEAWATQVSRAGIPTLLVSIPLRYMHTSVETLHMDDIKNTGRLVARFISKVLDEMEEIF